MSTALDHRKTLKFLVEASRLRRDGQVKRLIEKDLAP